MSSRLAYWRQAGLTVNEVPRRPAVSTDEFFSSAYQSAQPLVIEGAIRDWPAVTKWSLPYLLATLPPLDVAVVPAESAFPIGEDREPPASQRVRLHDYLEHLFTLADSGRYLGYMPEQSLLGNAASLLPDVRMPPYLPDLSLLIEANVWFGPAGNLTPLHYDQMDNLLGQVAGSKEVLLLPPGQADSAYLWPVDSHFDRRSRVDLSSVDLVRFPRLADARFFHAVINPTDLLYIPAYWLHDVRTIQRSISINLWWRPPLEHCMVPGLFRFLARHDTYGRMPQILDKAIDSGSISDSLFLARHLIENGLPEAALLVAGGILLEYYRSTAGTSARLRKMLQGVVAGDVSVDQELLLDAQLSEGEAQEGAEVLGRVNELRYGPAQGQATTAEAEAIVGLVERQCGPAAARRLGGSSWI